MNLVVASCTSLGSSKGFTSDNDIESALLSDERDRVRASEEVVTRSTQSRGVLRAGGYKEVIESVQGKMSQRATWNESGGSDNMIDLSGLDMAPFTTST